MIVSRTGVDALVDLEVLGAREELVAAGERARERLLACKHTNITCNLQIAFSFAPSALRA